MRTYQIQSTKFEARTLTIDEYDSMYEMVNDIKAKQLTTDCPHSYRGSNTKSSSPSYSSGLWVGTRDLPEALDRALYGWPEGLAVIDKELVKLQALLPGIGFKRVTRPSLTGPGTLDFSRYMQGHPKVMRKRVKEPTSNPTTSKIIPLYYNYAVSASIGFNSKFETGARIVALINALEAIGNTCELILVNGNEYSSNEHHMVTYAKKAGEALNLENIAFLLCATDMDRRLAFAMMENWDSQERTRMHVGPGYPWAVSYFPPTASEYAIKIGAQSLSQSDYRDHLSHPETWLLTQLEKFGITFDPSDLQTRLQESK